MTRKYNFSGETWAGAGSAHKGETGSVCLLRQDRCLWSEWAEKRKESTHYGQIGSSGSDTTGYTTGSRPTMLV